MISLQLLVSLITVSEALLFLVFIERCKERSLAIIAGPTCNNRKRALLLAAFDVRSCFARRKIELTKNLPGLD